MGFVRIKQQDHNNTYYTEFSVDTVNDIQNLPIQPDVSSGSVAICIENSEVYMLTTAGEWVMI